MIYEENLRTDYEEKTNNFADGIGGIFKLSIMMLQTKFEIIKICELSNFMPFI